MLLEDEKYVINWLSQYGVLTKKQVIRMLMKEEKTAEKIIRNLKKEMKVFEIGGGYYLGLDEICKPDRKMLLAVWVFLKFAEQVEPMAHYPAVYPSQLYFLKENMGYEIVVLNEGEESLTKLLQPQEELKYIIVLTNEKMVKNLYLPDCPCLLATVEFAGEDEPNIMFYTESEGESDEREHTVSECTQ